MKRRTRNPHPGEILRDEFLQPLQISQNQLALAMDVPSNRINDIVRGRRGISADTDLRLCHAFGLTRGYWLRLQLNFDLLEAKRQAKVILKAVKPVRRGNLNAA